MTSKIPEDGNGLIYVGIPRERVTFNQFLDSRDALLAKLGQSGRGAGYFQAEGHRVDRNRDTIVNQFLDHPDEPEWLLMIDSDMDHPPSLPFRLVEHNVPIVGALYFHRGETHDPFAFKNGPEITDQYGRKKRTWVPMRDTVYEYLESHSIPLRDGSLVIDDPNGLIEVDAIATGAMMIHRTVLEAMKPGPWFEYRTGGVSEDLDFCARASEDYGFPIHCDLATICGHYHWVAMGQAQFRMNFLNRGINKVSYTKRHASQMFADAFGLTEEEAVKEIEAGSAHLVGDFWKEKFGDKEVDPKTEREFYLSEEVGRLYAMELLHWNYHPSFTQLRQTLTHLRQKNIIEIGGGIGTIALQLIVQRNNVLTVEINKTLRDFIDMRFGPLYEGLEGDVGELSVVDENWITNTPDESFDVAVSFDTFEHMPLADLKEVVRHLFRVLKPGGHLLYHANWSQQDLYPMHHDHSDKWTKVLTNVGFVPLTSMDAVKPKDSNDE